jgi:predicted ATP-grasp superfamily ATP-dependent carboligase
MSNSSQSGYTHSFAPLIKSVSNENFTVSVTKNEPSDGQCTLKNRNANPALVLGEIGLVHSLSQANIPVYVGSEESQNPVFYSRFAKRKVHFSTYRSEKFIDELCEFGKTLDRKAVIFSDDDDALHTISKYRDRLSKYFLFSFPPAELVDSVLDKQKFSKLSQTYALPAPASYKVSSARELEQRAGKCTFPCIIKPVYRSDWYRADFKAITGLEYKKAYRCMDERELFSMYGKVSLIDPRIVLQEYIEGDDSQHYSVNMYVAKDGTIRGYYIAKKFRVYPIGAGMGSYIVTLKDDEVLEKAVEVVEALDLRGLLNIQFKKDCRTGEPKLIEIHFRNSLWGNIGVAAGVNLYELYYMGLTGNELPIRKDYQSNVKYIDLNRDIAGFFQYREAGKLSFSEWIKTYRGNIVIADFKASDPLPFLMSWWFRIYEQIKGMRKSPASVKNENAKA